MRTNPSGTYLFSTTLAGTVTVQSVNSTGVLTQVGSVALGTSSFSLNGIEYVSKLSGDFLYINNNVAPNTVSAFSVSSGGVLTSVTGSPFSTGGNGSGGSISAPRTSLCSANGYLFVMNSSSNNISVFSINSNGSLTSVTGSPFSIGTTASGAIAVNPSGTRLFAGTTTGQIVAFSIAANGALSLVGSFSSGVASRVDGMVVHPNRDYLVSTHPSSNKIAVLSIAADGTLSSASGSPFTGDGVPGGGPAGVTFNNAGTLLFVGNANFGSTSCSVYNFQYTPPNLPPVANAGADQTVECTSGCSATVTLDGSGSSDPDADTLSYSWGEASDSLGTGAILTRSFPKGNHAVVLTVNDGKGGTATDTVLINVVDSTPPTITCPADPTVSVNAGSCGAVVSYPPPTVTDNCGVASVICNPPPGSTFLRGETTVTCTAIDSSGNTATCSFKVTVLNHAPSVTAITSSASPVLVGLTVNANASFKDPDANGPHTAQWDWGDSTSSSGAVSDSLVTGNHTYKGAGLYTVRLTVRDGCSDQGQSAYQYVAVYDPNGGFATGGGLFDAPAGSYYADAPISGKANFRFVARYLKDDPVPTGNVEFQFKPRNVNFKSVGYQWLIITAGKAYCKGTGTINGSGNFGFLFSVVDGQVYGESEDKFRMKIWRANDGSIVFDNEPGSPDASPATTVISGGSIVVHTPEPSLKTIASESALSEIRTDELPHQFALYQNYPNPFNPTTIIRFELPTAAYVTLKLYNSLGQEVAALIEGYREAGQHSLTFNAMGLPSSTYIYRLVAGQFVETKKLLLLK